jgi:ABC-type Fe3+ transport system permease subunit
MSMVKLFFVGVVIVVLLVVGAFAAVLTPLMVGVNHNLGGSPPNPFHLPIPQPWIATVHGVLAQATPSVWLTAVLGLLALLLVYAVGGLVAHLVRRWNEHRKRDAELRWQARAMSAREQESASAESTAELETIWK